LLSLHFARSDDFVFSFAIENFGSSAGLDNRLVVGPNGCGWSGEDHKHPSERRNNPRLRPLSRWPVDRVRSSGPALADAGVRWFCTPNYRRSARYGRRFGSFVLAGWPSRGVSRRAKWADRLVALKPRCRQPASADPASESGRVRRASLMVAGWSLHRIRAPL